MEYLIRAILSDGIAYGRVKRINFNYNDILDNYTISDVKNAIDLAISNLDDMKSDNDSLNNYLEIQKMILSDKYLIMNISNLMKDHKAIDSINIAIDEYINEMEKSSSLYLKERVIDLIDIKNHIIHNLIGDNLNQNNDNKEILVLDELFPTILIHRLKNVIGVIAKKGGFTSHSAILCRAEGIPFVLVDDDIKENDVLIDTRRRIIITKPNILEINRINEIKALEKNYINKAIDHPGYKFYANCSSNSDVKKAMDYGFDGVGLFRTEFIFINNDRPLTIEEQYNIYSNAIKLVKDKPIAFRTFDIGDDKKISYIEINKKGVENYYNNPDLFISQINALLSASTNNNKKIKLLFPMIRTINEFNLLKKWVLDICNTNNYLIPSIGMMLETKDAIENFNDFSDVDFISIGTNDLTEELYNFDRMTELNNHQLYIDDLLNRITKVIKFSNDNNIDLCLCGELATIKEVALKLYKIGIKDLSVSPQLIKHLNICYKEFISE